MQTRDALEKLDENTFSVLHLVKRNAKEALMRKQLAGWTAMDILEHIIITESYVHKTLHKKTDMSLSYQESLTDDQIKDLILGDSSKTYESPYFLKPLGIIRDVSNFESVFLLGRNQFRKEILAGTIRLDQRMFVHPIFGEFTMSNWFSYMLYHAERHVIQVKGLLRQTYVGNDHINREINYTL